MKKHFIRIVDYLMYFVRMCSIIFDHCRTIKINLYFTRVEV